MPLRPCATCATPTPDTYCPRHSRDTNLPTRVLPSLLLGGPYPCVLCGELIVSPRGRTRGAPSVHHLDGDVRNNHPSNLALAHFGCNAGEAGLGRDN